MSQSLPPFLVRYREVIAETLDCAMSIEPVFMVAIARKAPRIIELAQLYDIWLPPQNSRIISDMALPYLSASDRDGIVSIFDDIQIYGSTMRRVMDRVLSKGFEVSAFVLAKGLDTNPNFQVNAFYGTELHSEQVSAFNTELVEALRYLVKPYDIEHPLLYARLGSELSLKSDIIKTIEETYEGAHDLTTSLEKNIDILNFTILGWNRKLPCLFVRNFLEVFHGSVKIRLLINLRTKEVTIEPISLFQIDAESILRGNAVFHEQYAWSEDILREVVNRLKCNEADKKFRELGVVRAAVYLAEWVYGCAFVLNSHLFSFQEMKEPLSHLIRDSDLALLFGDDLSGWIEKYIQESENSILNSLMTLNEKLVR